MAHTIYESQPHIVGPEMELVHSTPEDFPTLKIGEVPELAAVLAQLYSDAVAFKDGKQLIDEETLVPDRLIDFEILPVGEREAYERIGLGDSHKDQETKRHLHFLFVLRDEWGNDSEVVGWKFKSKDDVKRPKHKKREFDYMAATLKDKDGQVTVIVAEALEQRNALYVWRADASPTQSWEEVAASHKHKAHNDLYARQFFHKGDITGRVMDYLTMPADKYIALREREFKEADQRRQRRLAKMALHSNPEV